MGLFGCGTRCKDRKARKSARRSDRREHKLEKIQARQDGRTERTSMRQDAKETKFIEQGKADSIAYANGITPTNRTSDSISSISGLVGNVGNAVGQIKGFGGMEMGFPDFGSDDIFGGSPNTGNGMGNALSGIPPIFLLIGVGAILMFMNKGGRKYGKR